MTKYRGEDFLLTTKAARELYHGQIVEDISYNNANRYFGFEV